MVNVDVEDGGTKIDVSLIASGKLNIKIYYSIIPDVIIVDVGDGGTNPYVPAKMSRKVVQLNNYFDYP